MNPQTQSLNAAITADLMVFLSISTRNLASLYRRLALLESMVRNDL